MNGKVSYFACGVARCGHRVVCTNPDSLRQYGNAHGDMIDHYKWHHAELFGVKRSTPGIANSDWWDYGPIPDDIGPSFYDAVTGDTTPWKELRQ